MTVETNRLGPSRATLSPFALTREAAGDRKAGFRITRLDVGHWIVAEAAARRLATRVIALRRKG
jgi:hypothetical protein